MFIVVIFPVTITNRNIFIIAMIIYRYDQMSNDFYIIDGFSTLLAVVCIVVVTFLTITNAVVTSSFNVVVGFPTSAGSITNDKDIIQIQHHSVKQQ